MNFDEYLHSKKIDSPAFKLAEPELWESWKAEFEHISAVSFTAQKLYLINPIRRKYRLAITSPEAQTSSNQTPTTSAIGPITEQDPPKTPPAKIPVAKPVFKAKPKMT